jgi:hypothetical protein
MDDLERDLKRAAQSLWEQTRPRKWGLFAEAFPRRPRCLVVALTVRGVCYTVQTNRPFFGRTDKRQRGVLSYASPLPLFALDIAIVQERNL